MPGAAHASVLLLEDDWDHRTVFRHYLEHRGWIVREAAAAAAASALLTAEPADVLVLDLGGTNGWALLEELGSRSDRPRLLCVTGDARPGSRERAERLGADGFLLKPLPLQQLADTLEGLLRPARAEAAAARVEAQAAADDAPRARPVVLLVEDDEDARVIYRDTLDFAGYEVMAARDGVEGLRYAESRAPDIVVTDLHMPGMNGVDVARTLRHEVHPPAIIAVTADSLGPEAAHEVQGERPLFDQVLVKPVSPGELVRAVRSWIAPREDPAR